MCSKVFDMHIVLVIILKSFNSFMRRDNHFINFIFLKFKVINLLRAQFSWSFYKFTCLISSLYIFFYKYMYMTSTLACISEQWKFSSFSSGGCVMILDQSLYIP